MKRREMSTMLEIADHADVPALHSETPPVLPARDAARGDGRREHICPRCGHVEHFDSRIAGTCVYCPGLVGLVAA